jgi:coatomer protein complex subunit epsilon
MNIYNQFHQAQYQKIIDFDTSSLSAENALPARVLQLRAQIASGQAEEVLADVEGEDEVPELAAVKALAQYTAGNVSAGEMAAKELASTESENPTVQILAGTILQAAGKSEEALALLSKHSGSLEAYDTL